MRFAIYSLVIIAATNLGGAACTQSSKGETMVRSVMLVGHSLDVESCQLLAENEPTLKNCVHSSVPLPVITIPAPPAPPPSTEITMTLDRANISDQLAAALPALERCSDALNDNTNVNIRVVINGAGHVIGVEPATTNEPLRACMAAALSSMLFAIPTTAFSFTYKATR
jgi:hypothetical protein